MKPGTGRENEEGFRKDGAQHLGKSNIVRMLGMDGRSLSPVKSSASSTSFLTKEIAVGNELIFNSKNGYKKNIPYKELRVESTSDTLFVNETLPSGEYVISMFQDKNGNGKLDKYLFGIPKEPIGITNFFKKGIPGPYKKLKVEINEDNTVIKIKMIHFGGK